MKLISGAKSLVIRTAVVYRQVECLVVPVDH